MDKLPNELLAAILNFAMLSPGPLILDELSPTRYEDHRRLTYADTKDISSTTCTPDRYLTEVQPQHKSDWLAVSLTCRKFRLLGIPAFCESKIFAMSIRTCQNLEQHKLDTFAPRDQATLLQHIKEVAFLELGEVSPSPWTQIPNAVGAFEKLRKVDIVPGWKFGHGPENIVEASKAVDRPPKAMVKVLGENGFPIDRVEIDMWIVPRTNTEDLLERIRDAIYPFLESRGKMKARMEIKRKKELPVEAAA